MSSATCLSSEFKPGKSPVRLNSGALEFIVRSPFVKSSVDFTSFYVLRSLSGKGNRSAPLPPMNEAFLARVLAAASEYGLEFTAPELH